MEKERRVRKFKRILILIGIFVIFSLGAAGGFSAKNFIKDYSLKDILTRKFTNEDIPSEVNVNQKVVNEESVVIDVADKVSPSVVTISVITPQRKILKYSPFGGIEEGSVGGDAQDIGSGFIVSADGLIVTNKHVVSSDEYEYKVIDKDNKEYKVEEVNKDPVNDIALIKINASNLKPVEMGDSDSLKVGQFVMAIGTALGEFRHTVTTGVISGLGRGITAGDAFEGYVEELSNVIQTDAAINVGNSGGPLLNSAGQVIGINVAVAEGAQNVNFAIPINVVKEAITEFQTNGQFKKQPYLGVRYQMIDKETAILNEVSQGAYVIEVIPKSPADTAGLKNGDIIVKIDDQKVLDEDGGLSKIVAGKKSGDEISLEITRDGITLNVKATLGEGT